MDDSIPYDRCDDHEIARIAAHLAFHVAVQNERGRQREMAETNTNQSQKGNS